MSEFERRIDRSSLLLDADPFVSRGLLIQIGPAAQEVVKGDAAPHCKPSLVHVHAQLEVIKSLKNYIMERYSLLGVEVVRYHLVNVHLVLQVPLNLYVVPLEILHLPLYEDILDLEYPFRQQHHVFLGGALLLEEAGHVLHNQEEIKELEGQVD